jgi:predicted GTPase
MPKKESLPKIRTSLGMILDQLKGVAILVNKWDLVIKDDETFYAFTRTVREAFKFIPYAPLIFISAKTGRRVDQSIADRVDDCRRAPQARTDIATQCFAPASIV